MDTGLAVNINLYNLEDVKFEGSKYVLTSPRSLEACSRLNVKPVELLYRPLSEFQEELLPQDVPLRTIYTVYDESEQIRQRKLKLCREERSRIMQGEKKEAARGALKSRMSTLPSQDVLEKKSNGTKKLSVKSNISFKTGIKGKPLCRIPDKESPKLHRELLSKKERNPPRPKSAMVKLPQKSLEKKRIPQRCSTSVTRGSKVKYRPFSAPSKSVSLPARDEKILRLMKERRESELRSIDTSGQEHQLWEDQRRREEALRAVLESKRRAIQAENKLKDMKRAKERERKLKEEEEEKELLRLKLQESDLKTDMHLMNQLRMRELSLSDKIRKESAKKRSQELNLKAKERSEGELKQLRQMAQVDNLNTATVKRDVRLHQDYLRKFLDNKKEREQFELRHNQVVNFKRQNEENVREMMEMRMSQAESNLSQVLQTRNRQLEQQHQDEEAKHERARCAHKKIEQEMEAWRASLMQHKTLMESRASEVASQSIEMKAQQARKSRLAKEEEQRKNFTKIQREGDKYRKQLELSLSLKDQKISDLIEEKDKTLHQTRAMARLSETLRDDIREKYESDTFDKKALEAQLYANLYSNKRSRSPAVILKNTSSMKII